MTATVHQMPRRTERARLDALLAELRREDEDRLVAHVRRRDEMRAQVARRVNRWRRRRAAAQLLRDLPAAAGIWCVAALAWVLTAAARWRSR